MSLTPRRFAAFAALLASAGMAAPSSAAVALHDLAASQTAKPFEPGMVLGHGYGRHRHRDDGIGAGDIVAGVLVLGAVAAIAGAFDPKDEPRRLPEDVRYRSPETDSGGMSRAVDMCIAEAERNGGRVDTVEQASRDASGWHVSGVAAGGQAFSCTIGNDGRVRGIDYGAANGSRYQAALSSSEDRQYSDEVYARLRAGQPAQGRSLAVRDSAASDYAADPRPAYPGGPLPGEPGYDDYSNLAPAGS